MIIKVLFVFSLIALIHARPEGGQGGEGAVSGGHGKIFDYYAYPQYEFNYAIEDGHTGDHKQQSEVRHGDVVKGEYSFLEPDGTHRIVYYEADDKNGFNAKVIRKGPALHPQHYAIAAEEHKGGY